MPYCSDRLKEIQQTLRDRYGKKIDADGWMGPATEAAIFDVLDTPLDTAIADAENEGMVAAPAPAFSAIQGVPHISQGDESIKHIVLSPGRDTCQRSGCLTVATWACVNRAGIDIDIADFIDNLVGRGCYSTRSLLDQTRAVELWGLAYKRDIGPIEAHNYLRQGTPVILRIPRPHFYIGLGYDAENNRYAVHNPGRGAENFYINPTWVDAEAIDRFDVVVTPTSA